MSTTPLTADQASPTALGEIFEGLYHDFDVDLLPDGVQPGLDRVHHVVVQLVQFVQDVQFLLDVLQLGEVGHRQREKTLARRNRLELKSSIAVWGGRGEDECHWDTDYLGVPVVI